MLIYFKPRSSYITQDCYEFISISILTTCVVICCLVPVYSLCIKGLFLNWSLFRVEEHNSRVTPALYLPSPIYTLGWREVL